MNRPTLAVPLLLLELTLVVVPVAAADPPKALLTVQQGTLPIILSAPHGGRSPIPFTPVRKGQGVLRFVTVRDDNTAELTEKIADAIQKRTGGRPYVVIARFERKFADANRAPDEAFEHQNAKEQYDAYHAALKAATAEVKERWGRGLLIDVHGQAVTADAVYRGTRDGKSVADLIKRHGDVAVAGPRSLFGRLAGMGYITLPALPDTGIGRETRFNGGYITDAYGSHQGTSIDTIQMEFGGALRQKSRLEKTAGDVAKAIAGFAADYLPREPARGAEGERK